MPNWCITGTVNMSLKSCVDGDRDDGDRDEYTEILSETFTEANNDYWQHYRLLTARS